MSGARIFKFFVQWLVLVALQVLLFKDLVILNWAFCLAYVGGFALLPFEVGTVLAMVIALATGLVVDVFYDTLGIHAAASVLTAYLRGLMLKVLTPAGGYEAYMEPTIPSMGLQWYALFLAPLLALHAGILFSIEYADWVMIPLAFAKGIASAGLTLVMIGLLQNLLVPRGS